MNIQHNDGKKQIEVPRTLYFYAPRLRYEIILMVVNAHQLDTNRLQGLPPPGTALRITSKTPPTPYRGWAHRTQRPQARREQYLSSEMFPLSEKHLSLLEVRVHASPTSRRLTGQQVPRAVIVVRDVHDSMRKCPRNTRHPCIRCFIASDVGSPFSSKIFARLRWWQ